MKLQQLEDSRNLVNKIHIALGNAEIYAIRSGYGLKGKKTWSYYIELNSNNISKSGLFNSLKESINCLENEFKNYILKYRKFDVPQNINKCEILNYVQIWKSGIRNEDKIIYDKLMNIIIKYVSN